MEYSKAITKKLKDEIFIWDPTAYSGKGYWYVLGTKGSFGRPASKAESKKLGKPPVSETEPVVPEVLNEAPPAKEPKKSSKSDQYRQAKRDSRTPLGEMIFRKYFEEGEGLGSAIKGSISDKFKAKVTGIKETFDPLNISKKIFGNKLTAILGRKLGKDDEDIEHFTGYKNKTAKDVDTATKIGEMESDGIEDALYTKVGQSTQTRTRMKDSAATILSKLYNLIKKNHDEELKLHELERNQKKGHDELKNKWNKELIAAITGKKDESPPLKITDFNKFHEDLVKKLKEMAKAIKEGGGIISSLVDMATGAGLRTGAAALGAEALTAGAILSLPIAASMYGMYKANEHAEALGGKDAQKLEAESHTDILQGALDGSDPAAMAYSGSEKLNKADDKQKIIAQFQADMGEYLIPKGYKAVSKDKHGAVNFLDKDGKPPKESELKQARGYAQKKQDEKKKTSEVKENKEVPTSAKDDTNKKETASKVINNVGDKAIKDAPKETAIPTQKKEDSKLTTPISTSESSTKQEISDAKEVKAPPGAVAKAEPVDSIKSPMAAQTISENAEDISMQILGTGSSVIADNSQKINIINQNSDGLLVEQLTGVRMEEPTLHKIMRQNLRMV
jgi:hypothetical protein